jgi:hypothetical protein
MLKVLAMSPLPPTKSGVKRIIFASSVAVDGLNAGEQMRSDVNADAI